MRIPTRTLVTACALSAAFLVAGCGVAGDRDRAPGGSGGELFLEPLAARGDAPFTDPTADSTVTPPLVTRTAQPTSPSDESTSPETSMETSAETGTEAGTETDPITSDRFAPEDPSTTEDLTAPEDPVTPDELSSPLDSTTSIEDVGPDTIPESPDVPDGGGLIPDDPATSDGVFDAATDVSGD